MRGVPARRPGGWAQRAGGAVRQVSDKERLKTPIRATKLSDQAGLNHRPSAPGKRSAGFSRRGNMTGRANHPLWAFSFETDDGENVVDNISRAGGNGQRRRLFTDAACKRRDGGTIGVAAACTTIYETDGAILTLLPSTDSSAQVEGYEPTSLSPELSTRIRAAERGKEPCAI